MCFTEFVLILDLSEPPLLKMTVRPDTPVIWGSDERLRRLGQKSLTRLGLGYLRKENNY